MDIERIMIFFLGFRASRPGHFKKLETGESSPLRCSPSPSDREPGGPPFPNILKWRSPSASHLEKTPWSVLIKNIVFVNALINRMNLHFSVLISQKTQRAEGRSLHYQSDRRKHSVWGIEQDKKKSVDRRPLELSISKGQRIFIHQTRRSFLPWYASCFSMGFAPRPNFFLRHPADAGKQRLQ